MNWLVIAVTVVAAFGLGGCGANWIEGPDVYDVAAPDDIISGDADGDVLTDTVTDQGTDLSEDTPSLDMIADTRQGPEIVYWERLPEVDFSGGIYDQVPEAFSQISSYTTVIEGASPPDPSFMGASGVGNGLVFALFGYGVPTNSMHGFAGPGYDMAGNFYGDYSLQLSSQAASTTSVFDTERVARSLEAPVVITMGNVGDIELHSINFAPWFTDPVESDTDEEYLHHCVLRNIMVRNTGDSIKADVTVVLRAFGVVTSPEEGVFVEEEPDRMLVTRAVTAGGVISGNTMTFAAGDLEPGQEKTFVLTHCAFKPGVPGDLPEIDVPVLLRETALAYQAWESTLVDITTPDPMVNDFIDGMKLTLKLQTSDGGATCPMSEYTRTWTRDNMGPVLAMLSLGGFKDVEGYLDYIYYGILTQGDLKNSYPADLEVDFDAVTVPDWASMPVLGEGSIGKKGVSAETPSYMVMMYGLHNRFSGLTDRIVERQGLLHRCLFAQGFGAGDMLPFTGDETFRSAMNASFGIGLEEPHEELNWSGNSSALWLGAAREYERFATVVGLSDEAILARERFDEVEPLTIAAYTRPDKCFAALLSMADLSQSESFEDASLQVTWSGWKDGDDPYAQQAFTCLYEKTMTVPGEICSKLDPSWGGIFRNAWNGVYTGMLPGYTLHSMTVLGHPDAGAAFNNVRQSLSTSGNLQEYLILDDHGGLTLMYNPDGQNEPSDYTAKYRPWEGGIVLDAVMQYLVGFEPDANINRFELRPHLPNNWPEMSAKGLRAANDRFDVTVSAILDGYLIEIQSRAAQDWTVALRWDDVEPGLAAPAFLLDGSDDLISGVQKIDTSWMPTYVLPDMIIPGGETIKVVVSMCDCF